MGRTLQRTATSTNIKERLDFSCAIFGPTGDLIANAPHQPVHLGAMGEAVKAQMQIHSATMQAGDVWVSNHPAFGGSHLPDITVITPVIQQGKVIFFVANRGHHADVGGITPGSMPPFSKTLQEEGVVIRSFKLVAGGVFQEAGITELLQAKSENNLIGTRALADNLADLKAQVAANQKGIELLAELVEQNSLEVVQAYMNHLQEVAAQSVQSMLSDLSIARNLQAVDTLMAQDQLDDGSIIQLRLTLDRHAGSAIFDFSGTARQLPNNMNTPKAVTHSAVIYCLRSLVQSEIPLNQGCLRSVKIVLPEGSILSPSEDAAVVAGNVLTSQRITDVILKAFSACAASQGCMNNLTFGNESFAYYETMGGGAGAGPSWHGQSGVHTHMSNTRITDPEILEKRYPVLLTEFSIRQGSGGVGHFRGGDGLIREIEFLKPMHVAILSERRVVAPYGLEGGEPGAVGENFLIKKHGSLIDLGGKNQFEAEPGDRLRILTPGGGGYGQVDG
jgi:5-oxoprolinase (ATP-hydrolysing)